MTRICGVLQKNNARDAFLLALCTSCVPEGFSPIAADPPGGWKVHMPLKSHRFIELSFAVERKEHSEHALAAEHWAVSRLTAGCVVLASPAGHHAAGNTG